RDTVCGFFFSSRRRHTRCLSDWSSDVCSSDLADRRARRPKPAKLAVNDSLRQYVQDRLAGAVTKRDGTYLSGPTVRWIGRQHGRSEERRVGKECMSGWAARQGEGMRDVVVHAT